MPNPPMPDLAPEPNKAAWQPLKEPISKDKQYVTDGGRPVEIYDAERGHGAIFYGDHAGWLQATWRQDGDHHCYNSKRLVEVKQELTVTRWVVISPDYSGGLNMDSYISEDYAKKASKYLENPLAIVQVTVKCHKGEGL